MGLVPPMTPAGEDLLGQGMVPPQTPHSHTLDANLGLVQLDSLPPMENMGYDQVSFYINFSKVLIFSQVMCTCLGLIALLRCGLMANCM